MMMMIACRWGVEGGWDCKAVPPSFPPKEASPSEEQQLIESTVIPATQTPRQTRETSCAQYTVSVTLKHMYH